MTTFLFWNVNNRPLEDLIAALVASRDVDVLILAECQMRPGVLLEKLNQSSPSFHFPRSLCERIKIFTRFSSEFLTPTEESDRISIRRLSLPAQTEILLAAAHFPSKLFWKDESQAFECTALARTIVKNEEAVGHEKTLLVGDLNMNPFEDGVVGAAGFNGVMTRRIASRKTRTVQGRDYPFFYNPMWSLFGDGSPGASGTYYYDRAEHVNYFWNLFDQVLLRPGLMESFSNEELEIVTRVGGTSLLAENGQIDESVGSDHLPLLFRLEL